MDIHFSDIANISKPENYRYNTHLEINDYTREINQVNINNCFVNQRNEEEFKNENEEVVKKVLSNEKNEEDDRINISITKEQTSTKSIPNINGDQKESIFKIKKISKIAGRRKTKNQNTLQEAIPVKHGKSSIDNITTKVKTYFINSALRYVNYLYRLSLKNSNKKTNPLLQKIEPKFSKAFTKEENQSFLDKKMGDVFSMRVSKKCSKFDKNYNKNKIKELREKNEVKEVIQIFEKTVKELYEEYISEDNKIKGFNLDEDVKNIEKKYKDKDEDYPVKFRNTAMKLIEILSKKGRISSKAKSKLIFYKR